MKHVFIFGAGASREAGAPLMRDFLDRAQDLLRLKANGIVQARDEFALVFDALADLQGVYAKAYLDLDNLETVFGAIEMGQLLGKLGRRNSEEVGQLRTAFVTLIFKTLESSIAFPVRSERVHPPPPYDKFGELLKSVRDKEPHQDPSTFAFITFNYDICLEYALSFGRIGYDYCLEGRNSSGRAPLLKLHGSLNWGTSAGGEIVPWYPHEVRFNFLEGPEVYFDLGSQLPHKEHKGERLQGPPVIVPPTWNKNSYHGQLSNVWAAAASELASADNIIVIGYSMPETDSFFRYLYALGAESKTRLRNFAVVNSDSGGVTENRFRSFIGKGVEGRFRYIGKTFGQALGEIKDILLKP